ncbi:MAG: penicillin-binding protein 2 [Rhodocyclaceae bacterium]|nr:penicillin-binding protein 2 [Rhodocyclaceae bacterium]
MTFDAPEQELQHFRRRLLIAGGFMLVCFAVLVARFGWLQISRYDYYHTRAEDNRIALVPIVPNRGLIVDRNGEVLARNYAAYTLEVLPGHFREADAIFDRLQTVVEITQRDRRRYRKILEESRNFDSVPIRTRLSDAEVARFVARRFEFPEVEVKARLFRDYPNGALAAHVIGYIGRINDRDLTRIEARDQEANYRGTEHIGKVGLEQSYEGELHGITGVEEVEVDAGGRAVRQLRRTPPTSGNNLVLTLDRGLQQVAEAAFGERRGALVAIEPSSGGVLAMVSAPSYDPNLFVDGISTQDWDALNNSPDHPLLNRALSSANPPGSTFKPFMALAALTTGKRTPEQAISDPGYFDFGGHRFRDDKVGGHGMVDMYDSIAFSCNTYYYRLAADLGIEQIAEFMGRFGLGSKTGVDIEGESSGVLPSPEWKRQRFRRAEQKKWFAGETISVGIGQGYNAYTPIQLASAVATLAADGVRFRPHVVRYVEDVSTGARRVIEPEPLDRLPLAKTHVDFIKQAMEGVNIEGTGRRAFANVPYRVAGKTGTAQVFSLRGATYRAKDVKERLRDHSLYVAFAPVEAPRIALAVLVENGGFGSQAAAPIARQLLDYYLLGIRPAGEAEADEDASDAVASPRPAGAPQPRTGDTP